MTSRALISKIRCSLPANQKKLESSMYNNRICPICAHQFPVDRKHLTDGFIWCTDCHAVKHIDSKTSKRTHYLPSEDEDD